MAKLAINLLGWNHKDIISPTIEGVLNQSYSDFEFFYMDNASGDGSVQMVREKFPSLKITANSENLGYAGGHNLFFSRHSEEFLMVLNPDVVLDKNFLSEAMKAFEDEKVGAVCGKMLRPGGKIIDGTGIVVSRSRRARERGQNEIDIGQYDKPVEVFGVSGQAAIFRKSALEKIALPKDSGREYFDEDFFAYFEDFDLSWRLRLSGYKSCYIPSAWGYHDRKAASSPGGYKRIFSFIRHHRGLSPQIKKWNWKNHIFCIIKNDFGFPVWRDMIFILGREAAMLLFILIFETATLSVLPQFFKELPLMLRKRRIIQAGRKVTGDEIGNWFK